MFGPVCNYIYPSHAALEILITCVILIRLGLIPKLKAISQNVTSVNMYSNQKRKLVTNINSSFYQDKYGYPLLAFERSRLQDLLVSELRENGVVVNFGHNCVGVSDRAESPGAVVAFENGVEVEADVVVGADGGNSFLRSLTVPGGAIGDQGGGIKYTGWTTVYGITDPIAQAPTEDQTQLVSSSGCSHVCWPLPGKQQFWAVTLNEPFPGPRPDKQSLQKSLDRCQGLWFPESYGGNGDFMRGIVERSIRTIKIPLMSGRWETPNLGRIVLIGDGENPQYINFDFETLIPFQSCPYNGAFHWPGGWPSNRGCCLTHQQPSYATRVSHGCWTYSTHST